jgi:hypothetical protein
MQKKQENSLHSVANDYLCLDDEEEIAETMLDKAPRFVSTFNLLQK